MYLNKMKFEKKKCLEYYQMTCIAKTKHTSERGLFHEAFAQNLGHSIPIQVTSFRESYNIVVSVLINRSKKNNFKKI